MRSPFSAQQKHKPLDLFAAPPGVNDSTCSARDASSSSNSIASPADQQHHSKRRIISPTPDASIESHLRIALALGVATPDLVATSLNNAIASVRSGEVPNIPVSRVLHLNKSAAPSVANSVVDLTPKRAAKPQAQTLFF